MSALAHTRTGSQPPVSLASVAHAVTSCWYVPPRPKFEPGDVVPLDSDREAEFVVVIDSVSADGSSVGHLEMPSAVTTDPCGGNVIGGRGCTCDPPL